MRPDLFMVLSWWWSLDSLAQGGSSNIDRQNRLRCFTEPNPGRSFSLALRIFPEILPTFPLIHTVFTTSYSHRGPFWHAFKMQFSLNLTIQGRSPTHEFSKSSGAFRTRTCTCSKPRTLCSPVQFLNQSTQSFTLSISLAAPCFDQ